MRIAPPLVAAFAALLTLAACAGEPAPTPVLPDDQLASPDAFTRSVQVGTASYLYRRRADEPSLFDVRVAGLRRTPDEAFLRAVATVYGCTSMELVGVNRTRTAALVRGSACKRSQYFAE
jgi:hypothetical protein